MRKLVLGFLCFLASVHTAAAAEPTGEWVVEGGEARVRIENCAGAYWGVVAWEQTAGTDENNPDTSKRARPTLGLPIMLAMKPAKPNRWDGQIYNTEDGRTYTANISLSSPDVLRVQGCVLGVLCGGQDWTRYKETTPPVPAPAAARPSAGGRGAAQAAPAGRETTQQLCARVTAAK